MLSRLDLRSRHGLDRRQCRTDVEDAADKSDGVIGRATPLTVMGYIPAGLADVASVDRVGGVERLAGVSPFLNPLYETASVGIGWPAIIDCELAVIVKGAGVTVSVPLS